MFPMGSRGDVLLPTWRSAQGDITDEEWELIGPLFAAYSDRGKMGRPAKHDRRDVVNAIFYVTATGCQWRALPAQYPNWSTVHRLHVQWSRDGTWQRAGEKLTAIARRAEGDAARRNSPGLLAEIPHFGGGVMLVGEAPVACLVFA